MARTRQALDNKRRIPQQARAEQTVSTMLEAAAQVLEAGGLAAFTTNAVAERAGVSIGTLYQYFPDKAALLRELAERELGATLASVERAMVADGDDAPTEQRVRGVVRALINAFRGRLRARRAVLEALLSQGDVVGLAAPVAAFIESHRFPSYSREQVFVLSRSLMGTIRAAVLEGKPFLRSQAFEDELVRLVTAYSRDVTRDA